MRQVDPKIIALGIVFFLAASLGQAAEPRSGPAPFTAIERLNRYAKDTKKIEESNQVVHFVSGESNLNKIEKMKLEKFLRESGKTPGRVTVVGWSDMEYPKYGQNLDQTHRTLASDRMAQIKNVLKSEFGIDRVDTFNMAESSNWLVHSLNASDTELKSVFSKAGSTPLSQMEFDYVKERGRPGIAIVVMQHEEMTEPE